MKYFYTLFTCCLSLFTSLPCVSLGQLYHSYNVNINNGLPSNKVYGIITDKHGYLWITTTHGVVRYNGYNTKLFNIAEGLPYEDIWEVFEDGKGRIWLCNTSGNIGYIYNNKYHDAFLKNITASIYPKDIRQFGNGIIFNSQYNNDKELQQSICIESNDTICNYPLRQSYLRSTNVQTFTDSINPNQKYSHDFDISHTINIVNEQNGNPYIIYDNYLYLISVDHTRIRIKKLFRIKVTAEYNNRINFVINNNIISFVPAILSNKFIVINSNTKQSSEISIEPYASSENIDHIFFRKSGNEDHSFYVITKTRVIQFHAEKDGSRYVTTFPKHLFLYNNMANDNVSTFHKDRFWGTCIGTMANGVLLRSDMPDTFFRKYPADLSNSKYIGGQVDEEQYWWNESTNALTCITQHTTHTYHYGSLPGIRKIVPLNKDTAVLFGKYTYYLTGNKKTPVLDDVERFGQSIHAAIIKNPYKAYLISHMGFFKCEVNKQKISRNYYHNDRFNDLVYDSIRENYIAYNTDKVYIHNSSGDSNYTKSRLRQFGVRKIEQILIDNTYGNIFFKGPDNITLYNYENKTCTELFKNINLDKARVYLYKNTLVVAGRFGVLFAAITAKNTVSKPLIYYNIKNTLYNTVSDCQISWNRVIMTTDKGTYETNIPSFSEIQNKQEGDTALKHIFIVNSEDSIFNINNRDTLFIDQEKPRLQFDVISPYGNGSVKYACKLDRDSVFRELNANELTLPRLAPDEYHKLSIKAYDNVWKSGQKDIYLYVIPYWWQTHSGRRIVWVCIITGILLVLTSSVLITRKLVLSAAKKRHLRMELELKSIYAQINPHFIFNSLNSALLLVNKNKMEEAYTHISKFSRLLRAYIKSSRNKYITIAQELTNLKDYVELQQTRFKNRFSYNLLIHDSINANNVMIPSLLIQPFVENAINHGLLPKQDAGHLRIEFRIAEKSNELLCIIEDDGIGRKNAKANPEIVQHKDESYGDLLIKDLVSIFNKYEHMNIEIAYTDKAAPLSGTIVTIHIKNPHYAQ